MSFIQAPPIFIDFGHAAMRVVAGHEASSVAMERAHDSGRLTNSGREALVEGLRRLATKRAWGLRPHAYCTVGARGVSLRQFTLPAAAPDELRRLLALQIEAEFPLPPAELAWGYWAPAERKVARGAGPGATQEVVVAAVKKELLEDYSRVVTEAGFHPVFAVAALERIVLCPPFAGPCALLDIASEHAELVSLDRGAPIGLRVIPWGGKQVTEAIEQQLGIQRDESGERQYNPVPTASGEDRQSVVQAIQFEVNKLAGLLPREWLGQKLFLTGDSARIKELTPLLAGALGSGLNCERLEYRTGEGRSSALAGMARSVEKRQGPRLALQAVSAKGATGSGTMPWKWAALLAGLLICSVGLRYAGAFLRQPTLEQRFAEARDQAKVLPTIDRELSFLHYLETNQPPFLDALVFIADAAPRGVRIDSLSMDQRGEVSLRCKMGNSQQTVDFRSKLIDSGFFSTVVVEEQTPVPNNNQQVTVRLSAHWKPSGERPPAPTNAPPVHLPSARPGMPPPVRSAGPVVVSPGPPPVHRATVPLPRK